MKKTNTNVILNVFITNLAAYTRGDLIGEWVELPVSSEELEAVYNRIGIGSADEFGCVDEEIFITDYETDYNITVGEYSNIDELNEIAETIAALDEWELETLGAALETGHYSDVLEALENLDNCTLYGAETLVDLAYEFVDEGLFGDIPDDVKNYIDYSAIARDLEYDSYYETEYGVIYIG